jgi:hypothetical protein
VSAAYTLHVAPHALPGDPRALERASLVRDGFSFWAFLVPPLWFWVHRHWLVGLGLALALAAFWATLRYAGVPGGVIFLLNALLWLLVGLEASSLRRWDYARQGRPAVDVVFAANEADAEEKCFARWLAPADPGPIARPGPVRAGVPAWPVRRNLRAEPQVIGMFPDLERRP